jgi:hypothetical protein
VGGAGGGGGSGGSTGELCTEDLSRGNGVTISGHSHTLTIPIEDILAGVEVIYEQAIGGNDHTHSFRLTAAEFETLRSNGTVSKNVENSGTDENHQHTVTVTCG